MISPDIPQAGNVAAFAGPQSHAKERTMTVPYADDDVGLGRIGHDDPANRSLLAESLGLDLVPHKQAREYGARMHAWAEPDNDPRDRQLLHRAVLASLEHDRLMIACRQAEADRKALAMAAAAEARKKAIKEAEALFASDALEGAAALANCGGGLLVLADYWLQAVDFARSIGPDQGVTAAFLDQLAAQLGPRPDPADLAVIGACDPGPSEDLAAARALAALCDRQAQAYRLAAALRLRAEHQEDGRRALMRAATPDTEDRIRQRRMGQLAREQERAFAALNRERDRRRRALERQVARAGKEGGVSAIMQSFGAMQEGPAMRRQYDEFDARAAAAEAVGPAVDPGELGDALVRAVLARVLGGADAAGSEAGPLGSAGTGPVGDPPRHRAEGREAVTPTAPAGSLRPAESGPIGETPRARESDEAPAAKVDTMPGLTAYLKRVKEAEERERALGVPPASSRSEEADSVTYRPSPFKIWEEEQRRLKGEDANSLRSDEAGPSRESDERRAESGMPREGAGATPAPTPSAPVPRSGAVELEPTYALALKLWEERKRREQAASLGPAGIGPSGDIEKDRATGPPAGGWPGPGPPTALPGGWTANALPSGGVT
jgi:hypothetical protein